MNQDLQIKAHTKLLKAKTAMERCEKAINDPAQFQTEWEFFLVALNAVFSFLEQATKEHSKLAPWFGRLKNTRKKDPLLRYLHHARNAEQHGIEPVVEMRRTTTFSSASGAAGRVKVWTDANGRKHLNVTTTDGSPVVVNRSMPRIVLSIVRDSLHKDEFQPPAEHLGKKLDDDSPLAVGRLGLLYAEAAVKEACALARKS